MLFHEGLAPRLLIALEGDDGNVVSPQLRPVGDLPGVDLPGLLHGDGVHRILLVHHKDEGVRGEGGLQPFEALLLLLRQHVGVGLPDDEQVGPLVDEFIVSLGGLAELYQVRDLLPALSQEGAAHRLRQGHRGGGAVEPGKVLPGEAEGRGLRSGIGGLRGLREALVIRGVQSVSQSAISVLVSAEDA